MDNKKAIDILNMIEFENAECNLGTWYHGIDDDMKEAIEMAIKALEQQDKTEKLLSVGVLKDCESCKASRMEFRHFTFGYLVKCLRESKEWTQRDLSMRSGISNAEISRIETGKRKDPGIKSICNLSKAFNINVVKMIAPFYYEKGEQ